MKTVRGAVIGYGGAFNMGKIHANQMKDSGIAFVAACDMDQVRAEQAAVDFPGIRTYTKVEDLLSQDDIDLVTIITPHNTHAELAKQVLESGKSCILEKPMCIRADDAFELTRLANERGLMLSVFHNRRWDAWYLTLLDLIKRDLLGKSFTLKSLRAVTNTQVTGGVPIKRFPGYILRLGRSSHRLPLRFHSR